MFRSGRVTSTVFTLTLGLLCLGGLGIAKYYRLGVGELLEQTARVVGGNVLAVAYKADRDEVIERTATYRIGNPTLQSASSVDSWKQLDAAENGFQFLGSNMPAHVRNSIPFVYERADAPHLVELKRAYDLADIVGDRDSEYAAMLRLVAWLGTRWDHGPEKNEIRATVCRPAELISAGANGEKLWCEIAAKITVQAASAVDWQARLVTISRDGYTWEHAVAELWSNEFDKWFVVDTDFNVVFESDGVPLSAYEILRHGELLQRNDRLRQRQFARPKPSLAPANLLPFFNYVHIDLRNDWCSRPLRRGSPVGGDLPTWWTSRPSLGPVLNTMARVDDPEIFDWKVNTTDIHVVGFEAAGIIEPAVLRIALTGYSPVFSRFLLRIDSGDWTTVAGSAAVLSLFPGKHLIQARMITTGGDHGPLTEVRVRISK